MLFLGERCTNGVLNSLLRMYHLKWILGADEWTLAPSPQTWMRHVGGSARAGKLASFPPLEPDAHATPPCLNGSY